MSFIHRFLMCSALQFVFLIPAQGAETDAVAKMTNQINKILRQRNRYEYHNAVSQSATLVSPDALPAGLCPAPELSVPESPHLAGNRSVLAKCAARNYYLQIAVHAEGSYWVAARNLPARQPLKREDIRIIRGSLDTLPSGILFSTESATGLLPARPLEAGQPLLKKQLKQQWLATTGQMVDIISAGADFQIQTRGKALSNAAANQPVKVRMKSGQVVAGVTGADGIVRADSQRKF